METVTRALTVGVDVPRGDGERRPEGWARLHAGWDASQRAANAAMRVYVTESPEPRYDKGKGKWDMGKIPPEVGRRAYAAARAVSPELPSGSVAHVCQQVRLRWAQDRWAVTVAGRQSVPTFRRPLAYAVRRQDWALSIDDDGRVLATFAIGELMRGERPVVRLHARTARDRDTLERIVSGEYERATLEISPAGWKRSGRVSAKVVYKRPRPDRREAGGVLELRTAAEALLETEVGGRAFVFPGDDLRETILAYERRRWRHSQAMKFEGRVPSERRRNWRRDGEERARKHHNRVRTALQQLASSVARKARRHGMAGVVLDTSERGFCEPFPWHQLETLISQKCEIEGLAFTLKAKESTPEKTDNGGCPADKPGERADAPVTQATSHAGTGRRKGRGM